jgi:hypothetical protein
VQEFITIANRDLGYGKFFFLREIDIYLYLH